MKSLSGELYDFWAGFHSYVQGTSGIIDDFQHGYDVADWLEGNDKELYHVCLLAYQRYLNEKISSKLSDEAEKQAQLFKNKAEVAYSSQKS